MRWAWLFAVALVLVFPAVSWAAGPSDSPPQLYLPARHVWQSRNNCGPSAVAMAASVFGISVDPEGARWSLRPEVESVGMDAARVPRFVATLGLAARPRVNGSLDVVRRLVANDVPVVVEQWLSAGQRIEHYRLVVGYDALGHRVLVHDSTLGPYVWFSEAEFQALWTPTGRPYIPIYLPNQEATVRAIVGADWDDTVMYQGALQQAVTDVWASPNDAWVWARLGQFAYAVGDARTALTAWGYADLLALPQGELWLPGWMAAAALDAGDPAAALRYVNRALERYPSSAGLHYVRGRALQALGNGAEAAAAFRRALDLEPGLTPARAALDNLR